MVESYTATIAFQNYDDRFENLEKLMRSGFEMLAQDFGAMRKDFGELRHEFRELRHDFGERTDVLANYVRLTDQGYFRIEQLEQSSAAKSL